MKKRMLSLLLLCLMASLMLSLPVHAAGNPRIELIRSGDTVTVVAKDCEGLRAFEFIFSTTPDGLIRSWRPGEDQFFFSAIHNAYTVEQCGSHFSANFQDELWSDEIYREEAEDHGQDVPADFHANAFRLFRLKLTRTEEKDAVLRVSGVMHVKNFSRSVDVSVSLTTAHTHTWDAGKITVQATCGKAGEKVYTCSGCSETKTQTIAATGKHTWDTGRVTAQATCGKAGEKVYTCSVCSETRKQTIAATGKHAWSDWVTIDRAAGTHTRRCVTCGLAQNAAFAQTAPRILSDGIEDTGNMVVCSGGINAKTLLAAVKDAEALQTGNGEAVSPAAAVCNGMQLVCGAVRIPVSIPGDVDCDGEILAADARLTLRAAVGLDTLSGAQLDAALVKGAKSVTAGEARLILRRAVGAESLTCSHQWETEEKYLSATCGTDGWQKCVCTVCGGTKADAVPATGKHKWDAGKTEKKQTCTTDGLTQYVCTVCGEAKKEVLTAPGHKWAAGAYVLQPSCTAAGTQNLVCSVCGAATTQTVAALGHDLTAATCDAAGYCKRCGAVSGAPLGHAYRETTQKKATCTEDGILQLTCTRCGSKTTQIIPKTGHDFADATVTKPKTCRICGATEGNPLDPPANKYAYLAGNDFRQVRSQYSRAVAQAGYVVAYYNCNGELCVLTFVKYKIISNYEVTTLHNITTGQTIREPVDYFEKMANRSAGARKLNYMDQKIEVLERKAMALQGINDAIRTGKASGTGVYVPAATLNV